MSRVWARHMPSPPCSSSRPNRWLVAFGKYLLFFQGRHFLKLHPLSFGANYILPGAQVRGRKQHGFEFFVQLYTVSEVVGSFLDEIKDEGGTIHFCGALDKVNTQ